MPITKDVLKKVPKTEKTMTEEEWRSLGIKRSKGWKYYYIYHRELSVIMLRKLIDFIERKQINITTLLFWNLKYILFFFSELYFYNSILFGKYYNFIIIKEKRFHYCKGRKSRSIFNSRWFSQEVCNTIITTKTIKYLKYF